MQRDLYHHLLQWQTSSHRKPLILRGARQVGKTYLLQDFGRRQYEDIAYFNFEQDPDLDDLFSGALDPGRLVQDLALYQGRPIEPARHLIVFDEIQASNRALNSLKYFNENANQYHIAAAGSLLGVKLSRPSTFPVGKVQFLDLHPLTFAEFLDAVGRSPWRVMIAERDDFTPFPAPFHRQLTDLLRQYYYVGGMPAAVSRFIDGDLPGVRQTQWDIIDAYALDFAKHAQATDIPKLSLIWEAIPAQLARENKKFMFSLVKKGARAREYENALQWLVDAGLVLKSYAVTTAKRPLTGYMDRAAFKLFLLDVGLLGAMARVPAEVLVKGDALFSEYQGAFVENYVAQQLRSDQRLGLYYWKSQGQRAEVDFLCEADAIYPLEAKAGVNPRSKSLRSFDDQFKPPVLSRTTLLNLKRDGKICNYPLYALTLFPRLGQRAD